MGNTVQFLLRRLSGCVVWASASDWVICDLLSAGLSGSNTEGLYDEKEN